MVTPVKAIGIGNHTIDVEQRLRSRRVRRRRLAHYPSAHLKGFDATDPRRPSRRNPDHRCCLACGNTDPDVTLRAITDPATDQQVLACTRHLADVAAVLDSFGFAPHTADQPVPKRDTTPPAYRAPGPRPRSRG